MKYKSIVLLLLITVSLVESAMLFTSNNGNHTTDVTLLITICFSIALLVRLSLDFSPRSTLFTTTLGYLLALVIKIVIDLQSDPTSHNLLPFELVISGVVGLTGAGVGTAIGSMLRKGVRFVRDKKKRNLRDSDPVAPK
jgi:hypothetical protein